ncbi:MAG: hypothetical protein DRG20_04835 [Deltaproteobacteria bacterium]|nr:thioredoxin family protein [Deltaproteobacteria bacterium]RLA89312.1 MAG: hypothetical protein DRG20_04835 [Deltaproteobacteria bacterium]
MGSVKIFVKPGCHFCPAAEKIGEILKSEGFPVFHYNIETPDGLAEAAFYSVMATPTIILEDESETTVAQWRGVVPQLDEIKSYLR